MNTNYIILGAGGAIGQTLAEELISKNERVKLVSRTGRGMLAAEVAIADLTNLDETKNSIEESSVVYLVAGLRYKASVWEEQWPKIMRNTVEACKAKNARLVFFDNVYPYGKVKGHMTEDTPVNPCSKKGEVRATIAEYLLSETRKNNITAMIARSADFYGPYANKTSTPFMLIIERLAKGKKATPLADINTVHSYTYTVDCGKALYLLGKEQSAWNQVWHLPTASPPLTGEEFIRIVAKKLGVSPDFTVLKKWMLKMTGIFAEQPREAIEMLYQSEDDYIFDSSKFEKHFHFTPTPYEIGIEETIAHFRQNGTIPNVRTFHQ